MEVWTSDEQQVVLRTLSTAEIAFRSGRYVEALSAYRDAVRLDSTSQTAFAAGRACLFCGRLGSAIEEFEAAFDRACLVERADLRCEAALGLALVWHLAGHEIQAWQALQLAHAACSDALERGDLREQPARLTLLDRLRQIRGSEEWLKSNATQDLIDGLPDAELRTWAALHVSRSLHSLKCRMQARTFAQRACREATQAANPFGILLGTELFAEISLASGDISQGLVLLQRAGRLAGDLQLASRQQTLRRMLSRLARSRRLTSLQPLQN